MRLIDADALINDLEEIGRNLFNDISLFRVIHNAPTIDAETVVRCGKCRYAFDDIGAIWELLGG